MEVMMEPYVTPGGKSTVYATSLRIWLTGRKAKAAYIKDENGFTIGSEIKARLKKSRFGTERRECTFKIMWGGDEIRVLDEESWFEAVKSSEHILQSGAWYTLVYEDGEQEKFQATKWVEKMENPKFKARILELMDIEVIGKYKNREGSAEAFENVDMEVPGKE